MTKRLPIAVAIDAALIIAFAVIGRRTHDGESGVGYVLEIASPFLIGYVVAVAISRLDRGPIDVRRAVPLAILTVIFGLALRSLVFDRGIAPAFMTVALITITVLLVGWRLVAGHFFIDRWVHQRPGPITEFSPPRELTPDEERVIRWLLQNSPVPASAQFTPKVESLRVVDESAGAGWMIRFVLLGESERKTTTGLTVVAEAHAIQPQPSGAPGEMILLASDDSLFSLELVWQDDREAHGPLPPEQLQIGPLFGSADVPGHR